MRRGFSSVCFPAGDVVEAFRLPSSAPEVNHRPESLPVPFHITPRKGQFVVYQWGQAGRLDAGVQPRYIIEPVPSQFTKGVICWSTVYGNVIVGPTAVDQPSRVDRSTDAVTVRELRDFGERVLPGLRHAQVRMCVCVCVCVCV
jgi:L-2-hydroxyglutarate oxidase LhgO